MRHGRTLRIENNMRYKDKVVIITGAAGGIGLATAKQMGTEGGKIVLVDFNPEKLETASKDLASLGIEVIPKVCDVSNETQVFDVVSSTLAHFKKLDVVVNNAGLMIFKPLQEHNTEDWVKVLGVDLLGTFYFTKEAFKVMKGGAIVNVSSIHAIETTALVSSYAAAKAAVLSLTRSSAIEGKSKGIRVNAVLPGAIDTPMLWENPNIKAGLEVISTADVGKAEDIADLISFLGSDEANFIQGVGVRADGGRLAKL